MPEKMTTSMRVSSALPKILVTHHNYGHSYYQLSSISGLNVKSAHWLVSLDWTMSHTWWLPGKAVRPT